MTTRAERAIVGLANCFGLANGFRACLMRVASLRRYPLKGFSSERLARVALEKGGHFPSDRLFAIENGPSGYDPAAPSRQPKSKFLMLMRHEAIARMEALYEDASGMLTISHEGETATGSPHSPEGRAIIERFLEAHVPAADRRGPLRLLAAPDAFRFTDSGRGFVSILNLASMADLEQRLGVPVDPLRFRANIHLEGLDPWAEFALVGTVLEAPSGLALRILSRIDRCAAIEVDPVAGARDLPLVKTLMTAYGHVDCGVYAEIVAGGTLAEGHRLTERATQPALRLGL